jgi:hypothetical protein
MEGGSEVVRDAGRGREVGKGGGRYNEMKGDLDV